MAFGAIIQKSEKYYTFLPKLFDVLENAQLDYNWLITDCECNVENEIYEECISRGYCWVSGEHFTEIVNKQNIQWIWAVFSGFHKDIPLEEVLKEALPCADENDSIWTNPVKMNHSLAKIEIIAFDSSMTLVISEDRGLVERVRAGFPLSEDLSDYNSDFKK